MRAIKLVLRCCLSVAPALSFAQTFSANFSRENSPVQQSAPESDEVKSIGRGVGVTEAEALKDAYRDAIERAIGLYIDAETLVKNDEVVKDQILTHSNAYISKYEKVKADRISGGLTEVRIVATIKKRALTKQVSDVIPAQTFSLGSDMQNLHSRVATKDKRNADAAALLRNVLSSIDPIRQLMKPKLCAETMQITKGPKRRDSLYWFDLCGRDGIKEDEIGISYIFKMELDREKYFKEVVPKLKSVLDQISLARPNVFRVSSLLPDGRGFGYYMKKYKEGGEKRNTCMHVDRYRTKGFYENVKAFTGSVGGSQCLWQPCIQEHFGGGVNVRFSVQPGAKSPNEMEKIESSLLTLIVELNDRGTSGKAVQYVLDKESSMVIEQWLRGLGCYDAGFSRLDQSAPGTVTYNVVFLDDQGNEVQVKQWTLERSVMVNIGSSVFYPAVVPGKKGFTSSGRSVPVASYFVSPLVGCAGDCFLQWQDFIVHKDDLAKIKQVRIELAE